MEKKAANRLVPAASRTIAILRLLGSTASPMTLKEISTELKLIPSTCLHILRVLVDESLVEVDPASKRYQLSIGVVSLARSVLSKDHVIGALRTEVLTLSREFGVSAVATRADGQRATSVATAIPSGVFAINTEVGSRYPIYMSATGRCYAAFTNVNRVAVSKMLAKGHWANMPDPDQWLKEVEETQRLGYAVDRENYIEGVTVVAAPVFGSMDNLTHSIGLVSISHVAERLGIDTMGAALKASAARVREFYTAAA